MKRIYASKIFQSSKRADKIKASLQDPNNKELVQQIVDYLDEPYQNYQATDEDDKKETEAEVIDKSNESETKPAESKQTEKSTTKPSAPKRIASNPITFKSTDAEDKTLSEDKNSNTTETAQDELRTEVDSISDKKEVEESTQIDKQSISASCYTPSAEEKMLANIPDMVDEIHGLLNNKDDTKGVARIMVKEDNTELWIHYEDTVNLNNVMSNVILALNSAGYAYLTFNRLARSDNAVVFEISAVTNDMQPIASEE